MNERNEIFGDWYEEMRLEEECVEAHEAAPVQPDWTDDAWDDWFHTTHNDGTPIKE